MIPNLSRAQNFDTRLLSSLHISAIPMLTICRVVGMKNADPISSLPNDVNIAAAFTYTVQAQQGDVIVTYEDVKPISERIASPVLVRALGSDETTPYLGVVIGGVFYLLSSEQIYTAPCSGQ